MMKTQNKKLIVISALISGFINMNYVQADVEGEAGTLSYDNRAYVHAIPNAPNPVSAKKIEFAKIVHADKAYGPAIYSYPSAVAFQETDFNVEYVDTAFGQAIYSYPNNNPVKPRLELSAETQNPADNLIVPVVLNKSTVTTNTTLSP
jgi:hypothetical protein